MPSSKPKASSAKATASKEPQARGDVFVKSVLEACLEQLAQVGFARLSIPLIAEQANVNKTSIYRRWADKDQLVAEALATAITHVVEVADTGSLRGDLLALASNVGAFMESSLGKAVLKVMIAEGSNPEVRAITRAAQVTYSNASNNGPWLVVSRAIKRGELTSPSEASTLMFALGGAIMHRVHVEAQPVSLDFLERLIDLMLDGALAKSAS